MSTHSIEDATAVAREPVTSVKGSAMRGTLIGLIPLGLLASCVALAVLLTVLARLLFANAGFFTQQQAAVIVLIVGLILTIAVFAVAIWRVLRRVKVWQQDGVTIQANAALWALGASALVIVVPILLALLLPQHPFP